MTLGGTFFTADLGGSSKYSSERILFEDRCLEKGFVLMAIKHELVDPK